MEIYLLRYGRGKDPKDLATIGELITEDMKVITLEDDYDDVKEYAHTRIPAGRYEIKLRKAGSLHERYTKSFPEIHRGMLHLQDVPNYKWIYIHCGIKPEHTAGCPLVGSEKVNDNLIAGSVKAYKKFYPPIADKLESGERVFINVVD